MVVVVIEVIVVVVSSIQDVSPTYDDCLLIPIIVLLFQEQIYIYIYIHIYVYIFSNVRLAERIKQRI